MAELKFEQALKKLESIVEEMEKGKTSLEDSLKKYEEGIKLSRFCSKKIEEAEHKIEILAKGDDGKLKRKPFKHQKETESSSEQKQSLHEQTGENAKEGYLF